MEQCSAGGNYLEGSLSMMQFSDSSNPEGGSYLESSFPKLIFFQGQLLLERTFTTGNFTRGKLSRGSTFLEGYSFRRLVFKEALSICGLITS